MGSETLRIITADELAEHKKPSDLWISINGKVYNVTEWVKDHPGGEIPLLNLAGQDATDAFIAYHPASAWAHLDRFYIGQFADYKVSPVSKDYRRLNAEFSKLGLFEKKGHGVLLSLIFVFALFSVSILGVLGSDSPLVHLLSAALLGFVWIQSGWVGHDSGHYNVMLTPWLNRFAQILTGNCLTGISIGWWIRNHTAHHIACNSLDHDPDLQHLPLFCISDKFFSSLTSWYYNRKMVFDDAARFFVSIQHWTFYPVMCFARANLFGQSYVLLLSDKKVRDRWQEIVGVLIYWTWYPLLVSCLPNWPERLAFVLVSFSVTGLQHVQFTLNHFSGSVYVGPPTGNDWFEKQTAGTVDIVCPPWMDWFHGGLQFQVEHHLFPRLPRNHLRKISPIVKELCKKHGLQYLSAPFLEANRRTIAVLRNAAMQARDLSRPVPKNLVWEAVNTFG
ncbi:delta(8)-fatty-acid desaturase 2-like [Iris pallida]|uniref:Delta(8)-fatty-acid desaturase 2-like n=1 Tax=Iris pallida TaxID=29817 RepID=A0AAX6HLR4_IRIPA|nr:delta(8)-fatty-acid desaturase 2-like [Iris pallida]KAJ6841703.1 delta(8)-fatty-acid desaturase 2-like [Iris pallida]